MKSQLRQTAQRLGQLQDKIESQGQITRRDIATLLQQGNVVLARAKAQKLIGEDVLSDLLQTLEMHVGVILGHLNEFERSEPPGPAVLEAAASILAAAPDVESRDLRQVYELLANRLGRDFMRSVNEYVSPRVKAALSARPPSAAVLDRYMFEIAQANEVSWIPDLLPQQKVNVISGMLDMSALHAVDIERLRALCSRGLSDTPPWLRPKVWRLLLGYLPTEKTKWPEESKKSRENYYELVRRLLEPFSDLPPPTKPLAPMDSSLMASSKELSQVPSALMTALQEPPEALDQRPLDEAASKDIRIACAQNLDRRLRVIRELELKGAESSDATPEIRLESMPEIRLDAAEASSDEEDGQTSNAAPSSVPGSPASALSALSTTLLPSRSFGAHQKHVSALLRLLYIHASLNPANESPHIASLLVPVYSALVEEMVPDDAAHVEADAFWLFEAIIGELDDLNDVEGGRIWTQKFSARLNWADPELAEDLQIKGLDPALPHYSFRWLVPVLTHTLPLPSVLMVWDALLSRPMRQRDLNAKLEYLVDICTSMLLRTRGILLRLGRSGSHNPTLWSIGNPAAYTTPLDPRELEDAFAEGMTFLQQYPIEAAGGIEAILQAAYDLSLRRDAERTTTRVPNTGFGARLRDTVWRGFATQAPIAESHHEDHESDHSDSDYDDDEPQALVAQGQTLAARLTDTVWRGISNESAMEAPPSPTMPLSPYPSSPEPSSKALPNPPLEEPPEASTRSSNRSSMWGYAEKLKESDAAATLAKVSTNWRVKALDVWNKRPSGGPSTFLAPPSTSHTPPEIGTRRASFTQDSLEKVQNDKRRGTSLPGIDRSDAYSPPARPAFFRPPRDSIIFTGNQSPLSPTNVDVSSMSDTGSARSSSFRQSLTASLGMSDSPKPTPKSGPRPLLLNSASLITSGHSRSPTNTPTSGASERAWVDSIRDKRPSPVNRESLSSASSVSPSDARTRSRPGSRAEVESGIGSRIVPLRSSRSPMTANSRRATPTSSVASSPPPTHRRMDTETSTQFGSDDGHSAKGWAHVNAHDSPPTGPSPPPPRTPDAFSAVAPDVRVKTPDTFRGSVTLSDNNETDLDKPMRGGSEAKLARRQLPRLSVGGDSSDSSATQAPSRNSRVKSKRVPPRLATAHSQDESKTEVQTLAPEWTDEIDNVTTPRALSFEANPFPTTPVSPRTTRRVRKISGEGDGEIRTRKVSGEGRETRVRKVSSDGHSIRSRKISGERGTPKHKRDSSAVEGDDEGYNDLLSAYESEENP